MGLFPFVNVACSKAANGGVSWTLTNTDALFISSLLIPPARSTPHGLPAKSCGAPMAVLPAAAPSDEVLVSCKERVSCTAKVGMAHGEGFRCADSVSGPPSHHIPANHRDGPDCRVVTKKRHGRRALITDRASDRTRDFGPQGSHIRLRVGNIDRYAIANGRPMQPLGWEGHRKGRPQGRFTLRVDARECREIEVVARDPRQRARVCPH